MKLPWVSRTRFEEAVRQQWISEGAKLAVESERNYLREKLDVLTESIVRIQRKEHGMSEVPRERPAQTQHMMPSTVRAYLTNINNASIRKEAEREMWRKHLKEGKSWDEISQSLYTTEGSDESDE